MQRRSMHIGRLTVLMLAVILLATGLPVARAASETWAQTYPAGRAIGVAQLADGSIYVAGTSARDAAHNYAYDIVAVKYSASGERLWAREFDETGDSTYGSDVASALAVDSAGNLIIAGRSYLYGKGDSILVLKYDPSGALIGKTRVESYINAVRVAVDGQDNIIVAGHTSGNSANFVTVKLDPSGAELWRKVYNGPGEWRDQPRALAIGPDGQIAVAGESGGVGSCADMATVVYAPDGRELWVGRYTLSLECTTDDANDVAFGPGGEVYTGGFSYDGTSVNWTLVKYNAAGTRVWARSFDGPEGKGDILRRLAVDSQGNIVAIGNTQTPDFYVDWVVAKYSPAGALLWRQIYAGPVAADDMPYALAIGPRDSVYVTGGSNTSARTVKYDEAGVEQWADIYDDPNAQNNRGWAITVDAEGRAVVAGESPLLTLRYAAGSESALVTSLHTADLDGRKTRVSANRWRAAVRVVVHDEQHRPVPNATVTGTWSAGALTSASCNTNANGVCSLTSGLIANRRASVTLSLSAITHQTLSYEQVSNHDLDGDSNGTTLVVTRP